MINQNKRTVLSAAFRRNAGASATALVIVLLSSCSGGDSDSGRCNAIFGGGTSAAIQPSTSCAGCTFTNSARAIDAIESTFGSLSVASVSAGDGVARATAQSGIIFGGGSRAGVLADITSSASTQVATSLVLRTYLRDALQEERALEVSGVGGTGIGSVDPPQVISFQTTKAYDAVEFGISGTAQNFSANIHEFCSN